MKKFKPNLKPLISAAALITLAGCNSSSLQVTQEGPSANPAPATTTTTATGQASTGSGTATGSGTSGSQASNNGDATAPKIFFERALTDGSSLDQIIAVSFSSSDSSTTTPSGVALKNPVDFSAVPILVSAGKDFVYLQSNGVSSSSLMSTSLGTFSTQSLYDFSTQIVAVSANTKASLIATIDAEGNVSLTNLSTGNSQQVLTAENDPAARIQLSAAGDLLVVRTAAGNLMTYALNSATSSWKQTLKVSSVVAASLNQDGSRLAYVTADGKLLTVNPAGSAAAVTVATLESASVFDLSWVAGKFALSYWVRLKSGSQEVRRLDTAASAPQEKSIARISVPSNTTDGVVCPTWSGDTLYFANFTEGEYQIERTRMKAGVMTQAKAFASPPARDEGFVCPSLVDGEPQ